MNSLLFVTSSLMGDKSQSRQIAGERATTISALVGTLDAARGVGNLSSSIRVFVLGHYRNNVATNSQSEPGLYQARSSFARSDEATN